MFQLDNTLISEELLEKHFCCDLNACKGACCVAGEAGAPLEKEEVSILENLYPKIAPFLNHAGRKAIHQHGTSISASDGSLETPLVDGKECAYTTFDSQGVAHCGIEQAYQAGEIDWQKPISCHLYPVRVQHYSAFTAVNYHRWQICHAACDLGQKNKIPIYQFVKNALVRKFGQEWFDALEQTAQNYNGQTHT
ncbi:MAG: DUF3109 family protein [Flavobacteriaceae bacterium]|jgi:hypothetical protein